MGRLKIKNIVVINNEKRLEPDCIISNINRRKLNRKIFKRERRNKMITKTIGKNTLGDNGKMKVQMRTYNRSTHNLSYIWRNTQAVGTLVPFMSIPMMKGDTFKIKLQPNG